MSGWPGCSGRTHRRSAGHPGRLREIEPVAFPCRMLVQTDYVSTDARGRKVIVKPDADKKGVPPGRQG
ncbi:hypothetical protein [Streptomyces niveiscabiei]|uniref:Uncharacterized protein n=1 Tax=Streptomyces niveiscabiei TaxID=164115 RepID=A0ABW9HGC9_9ACTN